MGIVFDFINHIYKKDGDIKPSVSEIVSFYFNKDLSNIPPETLKNAQDRGTAIHLLCDKILQQEDFETTYSYEYKAFEELRKTHKIKADIIEKIIYGKCPNGDYCGTLDLYDSKSKILYDIKTTYEKHIDEWTAQTNLYKNGLEREKKEVKKIKIIYLPSEKSPNKPEVIDLEILPKEKIDEIVRCYYQQERPKAEIVELKSLPAERIKQLAIAFDTIKRIQAEIDNMKQTIKAEMESRGIYNFQCPQFNISVRQAHTKKMFDSKKFKEDFPEIYENYLKESNVRSSINIDFKGVEND